MKIINCPMNGPRNAQEFVCGGEVKQLPDVRDAGAQQWADYIFMENNSAGVVREWWCHVGIDPHDPHGPVALETDGGSGS
jgi:sarcosine oxidase subunit delta